MSQESCDTEVLRQIYNNISKEVDKALDGKSPLEKHSKIWLTIYKQEIEKDLQQMNSNPNAFSIIILKIVNSMSRDCLEHVQKELGNQAVKVVLESMIEEIETIKKTLIEEYIVVELQNRQMELPQKETENNSAINEEDFLRLRKVLEKSALTSLSNNTDTNYIA